MKREINIFGSKILNKYNKISIFHYILDENKLIINVLLVEIKERN
jgi:hypothetical protein